jgi:hypothetical protein
MGYESLRCLGDGEQMESRELLCEWQYGTRVEWEDHGKIWSVAGNATDRLRHLPCLVLATGVNNRTI